MARKNYMQSDIKEDWFSQYNKNISLVVGIEFCSASSTVVSNSHNLERKCLLSFVLVCSACLTSGFIGKFILPCVASLVGLHNTCE